MTADTFTLTSHDGTEIFVRRWLPEAAPKAVVQIAHGMAEHSQRYTRLADELTAAGYAVYAEDHRGHGETTTARDIGYLGDNDGFASVVGDLATVQARAESENAGLPVFLIGHSMGSFLARAYAIQHGESLAGLVLSGTAGDPGLLGRVGTAIAKTESRLRGRRARSPLMTRLTFGQYNAAFKPARTEFDWLSRDESEVNAYVADPACGQVFTAGFYADLLPALARINNDAEVASIPAALPIMVISGDKDPVGANGKGVRAVADQLRHAGVRDLTLQLYPGARHELFNETNRDEVTADVIAWLDERVVS